MSHAPSFAIPDAASAPPRRRGEWLGLAVLAAVLLLQLGWLTRASLAASASLRPLLESACTTLGCTLPAWREPAAFSLLARDVIAPPGRPGVLRVQASFRNDARWPQPWPVLAVTLSGVDGQILGSRRFQPADYLGQARATPIAPGQAQQIAFDIVEPRAGAVGFDFRFE